MSQRGQRLITQAYKISAAAELCSAKTFFISFHLYSAILFMLKSINEKKKNIMLHGNEKI